MVNAHSNNQLYGVLTNASISCKVSFEIKKKYMYCRANKEWQWRNLLFTIGK